MTADTDDQETIQPGTVLDTRFRVDGVLGQGGFATIYRGLQLNIERPVAIKVLDPLAKGARAKEVGRRFMQEAKIAAQIDHPSIVNVIDFGVMPDSGQPYIVMELLTGWDLGDELKKNGPMSPSRIVPLFVDALEGLSAGHRMGVVHKDLKPSNLFLCHPGEDAERLCVLDFGVARLDDEDEGAKKMTQTGHFLGTPQYLAPEYVNDQMVTPGIDIYQMGLILVEALSGAALIEAETTMKCIVKSSLGAFSIPDVILMSPLGGVVSQALAFDPKARFADGHGFAEALRAADLSNIDALDFKSTPVPTTERKEQQLSPSALLTPTRHSDEYEVDATAMTLGYETDSAILSQADLQEEGGHSPASLPFEVPGGPLPTPPRKPVGVETEDVVWVAKQRQKTMLLALAVTIVMAVALWFATQSGGVDSRTERGADARGQDAGSSSPVEPPVVAPKKTVPTVTAPTKTAETESAGAENTGAPDATPPIAPMDADGIGGSPAPSKQVLEPSKAKPNQAKAPKARVRKATRKPKSTPPAATPPPPKKGSFILK